jgi:hypothetical protein
LLFHHGLVGWGIEKRSHVSTPHGFVDCEEWRIFSQEQTEKTNRGNSHEIPILEVSAYLFLLWKKERDALLKENADSIVSIWMNPKFQPSSANPIHFQPSTTKTMGTKSEFTNVNLLSNTTPEPTIPISGKV